MHTTGNLNIVFQSNDHLRRYDASAHWIQDGKLRQVKVEATYESGDITFVIKELLEGVEEAKAHYENQAK